ncbi:hypothetical protein H1220_04445 [Carnobacteriaceae bacterium zg-84]|nr:hypothetical protein H1220_04445 [Carnobacteriaceae bacterium zg-84]
MAKTKQLDQIILDLDQHINQLMVIKADLASLLTQTKESSVQEIKLEDVRAVLADKSRLGFTKEIKAIITACGATKLSDVKPQDYPTLLKKAEGLGHE